MPEPLCAGGWALQNIADRLMDLAEDPYVDGLDNLKNALKAHSIRLTTLQGMYEKERNDGEAPAPSQPSSEDPPTHELLINLRSNLLDMGSIQANAVTIGYIIGMLSARYPAPKKEKA